MNIFDFSDLAKLAGVSLPQARNWTSGRPLRIRPSVQKSSGTGKRNLYSDSDVFKLAIANRLRDGSVGFRAIRYVIEAVDPTPFVYGNAEWLILVVRRDNITHRAVGEEHITLELDTGEFPDGKTIYYLAQLSKLLEEVQERIEDFVKERSDGPS